MRDSDMPNSPQKQPPTANNDSIQSSADTESYTAFGQRNRIENRHNRFNRSFLTRLTVFACFALFCYQMFLSRRVWIEPARLSDDYRQNLFWVHQLVDPGLFQNDLIAGYMRDFATPGVILIYKIALQTGLSGPYFSKLLSLGLYLAFLAGVASLGYRIGRGEERKLTSALLTLFVLADNRYFFRLVMGGFSRNFAFPLQAWLLWALATRKNNVALFIGVLSSFLHPQTFMIALGTLTGLNAWRVFQAIAKKRLWRTPLRDLLLIVLLGIALALPLAAKSKKMERRYGSVASREDIRTWPEYKLGGRWGMEQPLTLWLSLVQELRGNFPLDKQGRVEYNAVYFTALLLYGSFLFWIAWQFSRDRKALLRWSPLFLALICSFAYFELATAMLARLYFPNRFLRPITTFMVFAFLTQRIAAGPPPRCRRRSRRIWWVWAVAVSVSILSLFTESKNMGFTVDASKIQGVAGFVQNLPKNTLLAAYPKNDADNLNVLGERRLFLQQEASHPLYTNYRNEMLRRTGIVMRALFPVNGDQDVFPLVKEGVEYVLINKEDLARTAQGETPKYDQPYRNWLESILTPENARKIEEYWLVLRRPHMVYEDETYLLVNVSDLTERFATPTKATTGGTAEPEVNTPSSAP